MSNTPVRTAHGLSLEPVAADWSALQERDVQRLLQQYPQLGELHSLHWHSPRPFSAAGLINTSTGSLFVKRHHHSVREAQWLEEEHRLIAHLRAHGAPVAEIVANRDGHTTTRQDEWTYEIHRIAAGVDLYRDALSWTPFQSLAHAHAAGAALAKLHLAAEGYDAPPRAAEVLLVNARLIAEDDPLAAIEQAIQAQPALASYLQDKDWHQQLTELLLPRHATLLPLLKQQPPLWTHNDWHASNLLWSSDGADAVVASVLDFGLADRTFALFDLANAIERNAVPWLDLDTGGSAPADLDAIDALLAGYHASKPLSATDIQTLAALLPLVHIDFAFSEIAYFHGIVQSTASADVAYHAYLIGHLHWFNGAQGQRLLNHLQQVQP